jgi:hypothetical protein
MILPNATGLGYKYMLNGFSGENVEFKLNGLKVSEIKSALLYNNIGTLMENFIQQDNKFTLNVENMPNGVYLVRLNLKDNSYLNSKILVIH